MKTIHFRQSGTFSVLILAPLFLFFTGLLIYNGFSTDPLFFILIFMSLTFLICLLIFYQLIIIIDEKTLSFKLGIGIVGKTYLLSDIKSCTPVTNSALYGVGIRMISNGWLYNVSGLHAIELHFRSRKTVVRIGTDKPDEIATIINSYLGSDPKQGSEGIEMKRQINPGWIIVLLVFLLPLSLLLSVNRETAIHASHAGLVIEGSYGMTIPYNNIDLLDTILYLPEIKMRTNGYALGNTLIGNFRLADKTKVKLFIKKGFPPYILIHSKDNCPVYISFENREKTIDLYNELMKNME